MDKTPLPKILSTGENFYFERGATLNTNMASFINKDYIFIFSNRSEYKNVLILDKYDFNGNYINSYKVTSFNKESKDILSINKEKNKIAIAYDNYISLLSITNL